MGRTKRYNGSDSVKVTTGVVGKDWVMHNDKLRVFISRTDSYSGSKVWYDIEEQDHNGTVMLEERVLAHNITEVFEQIYDSTFSHYEPQATT